MAQARSPGCWSPASCDRPGLPCRARAEDQRTDLDLLGRPISPPWDTAPDEEWEWTSAAEDDAAELYARWRAAVERSREAWAAALADGGLDRPSA